MPDWEKELDDLVKSVETNEDRQAVEAFSQAIAPYLKRPELLRTLLGKIQAPVESIAVLVKDQEFSSIQDLQASLPSGVKIAPTADNANEFSASPLSGYKIASTL